MWRPRWLTRRTEGLLQQASGEVKYFREVGGGWCGGRGVHVEVEFATPGVASPGIETSWREEVEEAVSEVC